MPPLRRHANAAATNTFEIRPLHILYFVAAPSHGASLPLPQDPGLSRTIRANRDLIFVVAGFSLPSIPLAVSIAGRGASSEALAFLAGILGTPAALSPPVIPDLIGDPESFSCLFVFVCHPRPRSLVFLFLSVIPDPDRGSRVLLFPAFMKRTDTGSSRSQG